MDGTPFGRYRLLDLLGQGGMGQVYRAYDTVTNRMVALKVLPAHMAQDRGFQERFRREANAAASLNEPHIVPIHDFGEIDGQLFVDMRLIDGRDLESTIGDGPLEPARAILIIEQVAAALKAAHKVGLVHRDVKPSNILITEDGFAYLIDFGIARAAGGTRLTSTGGTIGTWAYMAPERFNTDQVDPRSDTYALACVLYECLTGSQPFPGNSLERQYAGHVSAPPPRPSASHPGVPPGFDAVIARGMAKNPDERYQTITELAHDARAALGGPTPIAQPVAPPPEPPTQPPPPTIGAPPVVSPSAATQQGPVAPREARQAVPGRYGDVPRPAPRSTRARTIAIVATIAAVVLIAVAAVAISQFRSPSAETSDSSPPAGGASDGTLQIAAVGPIDENGNELNPPDPGAAADPAGDGKATCPPVNIAVAGALTGPDAALGTNIKQGAQLAIDRHNAANPGCQVGLKTFDTEGDPQQASAIAPQIVNEALTVGLVGPGFSGETEATGPVFNQAGLVAATPSATNLELSQNGWRTFFRGLANDGVQGPSVANYLKNSRHYDKVCIIDDSSLYGAGLARAVRQSLGAVADGTCTISVRKGDTDFSDAVEKVKTAAPDAVFYSGYYAEAAPFVQQLRAANVSATFVASDGAKDPAFVRQAGESSKDALLSCPCSPAPQALTDEYTKAFGIHPGTYSPEAYDLATILLKGIDSGAITRPALLDFVRTYQGQGFAGRYQWTATGELVAPSIWMYKVQ